MYKHNPTTPDWLYRPAAISEEKIRIFSKELYTLHTITQQKTPSIPSETTCYLMVFDLNRFDQLCPELNYFLSQEWGIRDHLSHLAFICLSHDLPMQVHVDGIEIDIALNMPVLNCHDSFTVWHDTDPEKQQVLSGYYNYNAIDRGVSEKLAIACGPPGESTEIGRCSVNQPHWININVPHHAASDHSQFRINASFRFNHKHVDPNNLSNNFYVA
jgi:hypothetical protein